ncbi:hypothetical protein G3545_13450 [Starkeya sp. ORNL1]|uniref:hypothetical protein n=1 Tax=Starkeya sp. ORNL1 TaxID=2709380 RepID=UPI001463A457|nr:hypothetical protein [Starkeya sp. ORNL1]QJP14563.1 hypothetical protein G3545_13450 [Starkeya sp. ORNL1]
MIGNARQRGRQMVEAVHGQAYRARRAIGHHEADAEAVGLGIEVESRHVPVHAVCFRHLVTAALDESAHRYIRLDIAVGVKRRAV